MCSKRSSRKQRGCPCRDEELKCANGCSCGMKKACCKNKLQQGTVAATNAGRNAFERHQIAVAEAKHQIMVSLYLLFVSTVYGIHSDIPIILVSEVFYTFRQISSYCSCGLSSSPKSHFSIYYRQYSLAITSHHSHVCNTFPVVQLSEEALALIS